MTKQNIAKFQNGKLMSENARFLYLDFNMQPEIYKDDNQFAPSVSGL